MSDSGGQTPRPRPRRHGPVRRWVVRPFFWGLAVLVVVFALVLAYVESESFERRFTDLAVEWLEQRLQREVEVGDLELGLYPLAVEVRDVAIGGVGPGTGPFAQADVLLVEATVGSFLRPGLTLDRIRVVRPKVTVLFDEHGEDNAPRWHRGRKRSSGESRFVGEIGLLEIVDGIAELNDVRYPLDLSARDLAADLVGGDGLEVRGRVAAEAVDVALPGGRPYAGKVEIDGTLGRQRVDVRQARVSGPDLDAIVSGIWKWGDTRDVDLRVVADARFGLVERLGYLEGFGEGPLRFEGHIRRRPGEWYLDGTFESPSAVILERHFEQIDGSVFGDLSGVRFEIASSRYGGGDVTGTVLLPVESAETRAVEVDLRLAGVDLLRLLEDQQIPIQGVVARVSGGFYYRFPRSRPDRGTGWADLDVRAAGRPDRGGLEVAGDVPMTIEGGVLRTSAIRLVSESQVFLIDGEYDIAVGDGRFQVSVDSDRAAEIPPLLGFSRDEPELWQPLEGTGTALADVEISGSAVRTFVRLDLQGVEATGFTAEKVRGGLRVDGRGLDELLLELDRAGAAMIVTGSVPFEDGQTPALPLRISIDSAEWPVDDVRAWLPEEVPFDGRFSGAVLIGGRLDALEGSVEGRLEAFGIGSVELGDLDAALEFDPATLRMTDAALDIQGHAVQGAGELRFEDGAVEAVAESQEIPVAALPLLGDRLGGVTGSASLRISVAGSLAAPGVHAVVTGHGIGVGEQEPTAGDDSRLVVDWVDGVLSVEGWIGSLVSVTGGGRLDDASADLEFALETDRLGDLLSGVAGEAAVGVAGEAGGVLELVGSFTEGLAPSLRLRLANLALEREGIRLENLEPVVIAFGSESLRIESLYVGDSLGESEAFVAGRIGTGVGADLDLDVQASLAASWFESLIPGVDLRGGIFDVIGHVGGTVEDVRLNGQGELREARALVEGFPSSVDGVRGLVLFYPGRVVLDRAVAEFAGGSLEAGGTVNLDADDGSSYRFQVSGQDLGVRYPDGWLVRGNVELTVASTPSGREIAGIARLGSARYLEDVQLLRGLFARRRLEAGDVEPWRSETRLDLAIELRDGLEVSNNVADLRGSADLAVRGSLARPIIFGTVDLRRGGKLVYSGQDYTIERGTLNFTNPYRIEPVLDLVATTELREYDVTLTLSGTPDRLSAEFSSNPPLAELEVLALLTGSRDPQAVASDRRTASGDSVAAEGILYGQATSLIAGRFNRLFGLDQLRIDPLTGSSGDLSSARVTVGKQLSRDLFVTYSYDPSQTEEQILELEWSLSRSLVLVLTQNGDGTYAVDTRWEKAF